MNILDYGYVRLIENWGSDEQIVEAARMSTAKGFQGWGPRSSCAKCGLIANPDGTRYAEPTTEKCANDYHDYSEVPGDEKLLRYLWEHEHSTPFEMAGATFECQAPIFVFREWMRHRTQSYAELSARYTPLPDVNYLPTVDRMMIPGGKNKQAAGTGAEPVPAEIEDWQLQLRDLYARAEQVYQQGLRRGVPKEVARLAVTVGRYSRMRASANLRNWLHFLGLRMDAGAQWEIRQYAGAVHMALADKFPRTLALFDEGRA